MADLTVTAASVLFTSGTKETAYNAGAAVTAGQCVYFDTTTSTWKLAQADGTAAEAGTGGLGIALHAAGIGQPLAVALNGSIINIGATTSKAVTYFVSATAGGVAPQADLTGGQRISRLGYATAADGSFVVDTKVTGQTV